MKILFVLGLSNPFAGASWTRIGFFAKDWSRRGHLVEVLGAFSYTSLQKRGVEKLGRVNIFNLIFRMNQYHPLIFVLNSIISFAVTTIFLISRKPQVVVVSVPPGDVGLGALVAAKLVKSKCVVDYRDEWEDYSLRLNNSRIGESFYLAVKRIMNILYSQCLLVVSVTPNLVRSLKVQGVANVRLITNGADTNIFQPLRKRRENENFTIFYSGLIGGYYRLDIVLKALSKLVNQGLVKVKFIIAGEGKIREILDLAVKLGVSGLVEYKGIIKDRIKLAKLIAEADVGLIPFDDNPLWKNALTTKFFEYCACGLPVIATVYEDSILSWMVKEYRIGLISPPLDEEKLAEGIYWIYKNTDFREASSKRARSLVEEYFDRTKISDNFLEIIQEKVYH